MEKIHIAVVIILYVLSVVYLSINGWYFFNKGLDLSLIGLLHVTIYTILLGFAILMYQCKESIKQQKSYTIWNTILVSSLSLIFTLILLVLYGWILSVLGMSYGKPGLTFSEIIDAFPFVLIIPFILAPFFEEFIFRRVIYERLKGKYHYLLAATCSAFLFSIVHLNVTMLIWYIILGFLFVAVYELGGFRSAILVHAALNISIFVLQYNT